MPVLLMECLRLNDKELPYAYKKPKKIKGNAFHAL